MCVCVLVLSNSSLLPRNVYILVIDVAGIDAVDSHIL